jgi:MFS family permease
MITGIGLSRELSRQVGRLKADSKWGAGMLALAPVLALLTGVFYVQPVQPQSGTYGVVWFLILGIFGLCCVFVGFAAPDEKAPSLRRVARSIDGLHNLSHEEIVERFVEWGEAANAQKRARP